MAFRRSFLRPLAAREPIRRPELFLVASALTETNVTLLAALRRLGFAAEFLPPDLIDRRLAPGDTVLSRLDVRATLDGVEAGAWELRRAQRSGVVVLNETAALLRSHDKLATALALAHAGVPHPRTAQVGKPGNEPPVGVPAVVKPRFGSWGRDVFACRSPEEYVACLTRVRSRAWFRAQGALVQELVPPCGYDLRVLVAGGRVVGAVERHAAPGEWRTNVALGARRRPAAPGQRAARLAVDAARAVGGDLVGIDLLPLAGDDYTVLEVNGAVEFTSAYGLAGADVFEEVARAVAAALAASTGAAGAPALRLTEKATSRGG